MSDNLDALLATVVHWAGDAIEIADPKAHIIFVNKTFENMTGFKLEDIKGLKPSMFLRSEQQDPSVYEEMWDFVVKQRPWSGQITRCLKDGRHRLFEITVAPVLNADGLTEHIIAISRDITERVAQQNNRIELLEQVAYLQRMESLGLLAGRFAHDFNNLLTAIGGHLDLALSDHGSDGVGLGQAKLAVKRATELTHEMLLYSGGKKPCKKSLCMNALLEEIGKIFHPPHKDINVKVFTEAGLPHVMGDPTQLSQALLNLVANAADAIGDKPGRLIISTGVYHPDESPNYHFRIREPQPGSFIYIRVRDNGDGIPSGMVPRIFDPYFTSKEKGHGLGLSSVMGIVKNHNGDISVWTRPGKGTEFQILLPTLGQKQEPQASLGGDNRKILVVDDEASVRQVIVRTLERQGMATLQASDGQQAWNLWRDHHDHIALVLVDWILPKMDGDMLFSLIREVDPMQPVIVCSGAAPVEDDLVNLKPHAWLQKPFSPQALLDTVRTVLGPVTIKTRSGYNPHHHVWTTTG